jgi:purine-binding chemotaxis protein CheW
VMPQSTETLTTPPTGAANAQWHNCLTFRLHGEEYGIDLLRVREIRTYEKPNWIAGAPGFIPGVLNMRGEIVPIVDLRLRFGLAAEFGATTVTVVVSVAERTVGLVVDSVSDVVELAPEDIKAAPNFHGAVDARFVTRLGLIRQAEHERMLILLDIERFLATLATDPVAERPILPNPSIGLPS